MKNKEFLLMSLNGEEALMKSLTFMVDKDYTNKNIWCIATKDYDINPFGTLIKIKEIKNDKDIIIVPQKNYHGFFANLICSEEFYQENKEKLDLYITTEQYLLTSIRPKWF